MNKNSKKGHYIFRASYTKNGITYFAKDYGKKAFKFWVDKQLTLFKFLHNNLNQGI